MYYSVVCVCLVGVGLDHEFVSLRLIWREKEEEEEGKKPEHGGI